jgi:hypothetical protein
MARLWHSGAELGHEHAEGLTLAGTTMTFDTGTKRTGTRSFKFDTSATTTLQFSVSGPATGRTYYVCGHVLFPAATGLPGANTRILTFGSSASASYSAVIAPSNSTIRLFEGTTTQIGSASAATISTDTWYRLELSVQINAGAADVVELRLDGTTVASTTTGNGTDLAPGVLLFGFVSDPGTSEVIFHDDLALNDDQGSVNNTWVGDNKVYALLPTADSADGNWTDGAGGTASIFEAVNNIPPTGVSTATSGATNQAENANSTVPSDYDAEMTTYTAAGIGATDLITAIFPVIEAGSSSTTGSDEILFSVVSNPAIADPGSSNNCDIVAGTYPASWIRSQGTMSENPTVTKGTAPVMRIEKIVSATRINTCCLMAMNVAILPNGSPAGTRYRSIMMVG